MSVASKPHEPQRDPRYRGCDAYWRAEGIEPSPAAVTQALPFPELPNIHAMFQSLAVERLDSTLALDPRAEFERRCAAVVLAAYGRATEGFFEAYCHRWRER